MFSSVSGKGEKFIIFQKYKKLDVFFFQNENTKLAQLFQLLALDDKEEHFESQPLSHNVRASLIALGNFLLNSHGKVRFTPSTLFSKPKK